MNFRKLFNITDKYIYLNHAATGIIPEPAKAKMNKVIIDFTEKGDPGKEYHDEILSSTRRRIADLINAEADNISFTNNTSQAIYIALVNIPFHPGDEIIVMTECFPAAKYIAEYNIPDTTVKYISFSERNPVEALDNVINKNVKAVIIDHVQYFTGEMIPIEPLSDFLNDKGIFLIVDGIQSVGSVKVDVVKDKINILACGGSKWLNGPQGTGFLYVNPYIYKEMKKIHTGWLGAPWIDYTNFTNLPEPYNDARRFELGTRNLTGIVGLSESIRILNEFGSKEIENKIRKLNSILINGFKKRNFDILTPLDRSAGIITARPLSASSESVYMKLKHNNILVSLRNNAIRISPHFYNSEQEIRELLNQI